VRAAAAAAVVVYIHIQYYTYCVSCLYVRVYACVRACVCVCVCVCVHIIYNTFLHYNIILLYDEGPGINLHACVYTEYVLCVSAVCACGTDGHNNIIIPSRQSRSTGLWRPRRAAAAPHLSCDCTDPSRVRAYHTYDDRQRAMACVTFARACAPAVFTSAPERKKDSVLDSEKERERDH